MSDDKKYISKLRSFSNCGVWCNFNNKNKIEFAPRTLIYGFNGTGKTTLSRVFSSVQHSEKEQKFPKETKFEIELSDRSTVNSDNLSNPFENNLLVFNQDFIERNFEWVDGKAEGIAYLSEDDLGKKNDYELSCKEYEAAADTLETCISTKKKTDQENRDFKTETARRIRELAPSTEYTQSYDARKIDPAYSERDYMDADVISDDELKTQQILLGQEEPQPRMIELRDHSENLSDWGGKIKTLLKKTPGTVAIAELEQNPTMLEWAATGGKYHADKDLKNCLLCGNEISNQRKEQLKLIYDGAWNEFSDNLKKAMEECETFRQNYREQYRTIPKESDFQPDFRKAAGLLIKEIRAHIEEIGKFLNETLEVSQQKQSLPTKDEIPPVISDFEIEKWREKAKTQIRELNSIISSHNKANEDFEKLQQVAFLKIRDHVLASDRQKQSNVKKACIKANQFELEAEENVNKIRKRRDNLHNELSNHGIGAGKLNSLLAMYLGHEDIQLNALEIGYQIVRASGKAAKYLSEGEKTALAFCYFLTLFSAEGRNTKDLVVVIDDPISSLDTSAQTHALSLLNRLTKKCTQIILLTHNLSFMNMVKREYQNLQRRNSEKNVSALLALDCRTSTENSNERKTTLLHLDPLLANYDTEYHFLFKMVHKASEEGHSPHEYLLPNSTRKLLEIFTAFIAPDEPNFTAALMRNHDKLKNKLELKSLERLIQIGSHGTLDGISTPPSLTIEEAIKASQAAMLFIKELSPTHFKSMEKIIT